MSNSASATIFYGVVYQDASQFPWTLDPAYGAWSFEEWCKAKLGPELLEHIYVGTWGYLDEPNWFIAASASVVGNDWESPTALTSTIDPLSRTLVTNIQNTEYSDRLLVFFERVWMKMPDVERFGWWLVSAYG